MDWLSKFPTMNDMALTALKKSIDDSFRLFTRSYGDSFEAFFEPLQYFLIQSERIMLDTPWPIILIVIATIAWFASRSWKIVVVCVIALLLIGYLGMWVDTMRTISM